MLRGIRMKIPRAPLIDQSSVCVNSGTSVNSRRTRLGEAMISRAAAVGVLMPSPSP
jgi:hypothetical protein